MKRRTIISILTVISIITGCFLSTMPAEAAILQKTKSQTLYTSIGSGKITCSVSYNNSTDAWQGASFIGTGNNGLTAHAKQTAPMYITGFAPNPKVEAYGVLTLWAGAISDSKGTMFKFQYSNGKII